jgi:hypothetical protein
MITNEYRGLENDEVDDVDSYKVIEKLTNEIKSITDIELRDRLINFFVDDVFVD